MTLLTADALELTGICGSNVRKFKEIFPEKDERYIDGVEVTGDLCAEHHEHFSWYDAASYLLNRTAQQRYNRLLDGYGGVEHQHALVTELARDDKRLREEHAANVRAWQERYDQRESYPDVSTGDEATTAHNEFTARFNEAMNDVARRRRELEARVFGELFADPANRSDNVARGLNQADERREERYRRAYDEARYEHDEARRIIDDARTNIARLEPQLPELAQQARTIGARYHELMVQVAQRKLDRATEELEVARRRAEEAQRASADDAAEAAPAVVS